MALLTEEARAARNAYKRAWYRAHPEKQREYTARYWARKAATKAEDSTTAEQREGTHDE